MGLYPSQMADPALDMRLAAAEPGANVSAWGLARKTPSSRDFTSISARPRKRRAHARDHGDGDGHDHDDGRDHGRGHDHAGDHGGPDRPRSISQALHGWSSRP